MESPFRQHPDNGIVDICLILDTFILADVQHTPFLAVWMPRNTIFAGSDNFNTNPSLFISLEEAASSYTLHSLTSRVVLWLNLKL